MRRRTSPQLSRAEQYEHEGKVRRSPSPRNQTNLPPVVEAKWREPTAPNPVPTQKPPRAPAPKAEVAEAQVAEAQLVPHRRAG